MRVIGNKIPYGKKVENNVVRSLRVAGAKFETGGDTDHNHKIDFSIRLKHQLIGVQFSLKREDFNKIKSAKIKEDIWK